MSNEYEVLILIAELENDKTKTCNWLNVGCFRSACESCGYKSYVNEYFFDKVL